MDKLRVIPSPDEPLVMTEVLSFEVKFDLIALIDCFVQTPEHLFFRVAQESFAAQVVVLRDQDLQLVGEKVNYFHIDAVGRDDFCAGWRELQVLLGCWGCCGYKVGQV